MGGGGAARQRCLHGALLRGLLPKLRQLVLLQLDRMHAIPFGLKPVWDKDFLALLYDTITQKAEDDFGNEVFNRVERTFCCGLQSADPAIRKQVRIHFCPNRSCCITQTGVILC